MFKTCPNCDKEFEEEFEFCPHCGQKNNFQPIKFKHFISDYLFAQFKFDSKLLITLKSLLFKPAFLTKEYLKGRQTKYIPPVRLYFFVSLLYFFVFSFTLPSTKDFANNNSDNIEADSSKSSISEIEIGYDGIRLNYSSKDEETKDTTLNAFESFIRSKASLMETKVGVSKFMDNIKKYISTGMFLLLPFVALIFTSIFFRKKYYIENLLFVIHLQSVIFIIATLFNLFEFIYSSSWVFLVEVIILASTTFLWVKNFYNLSNKRTFWKLILFYFGYSILFIIYIIMIFFMSIIFI